MCNRPTHGHRLSMDSLGFCQVLSYLVLNLRWFVIAWQIVMVADTQMTSCWAVHWVVKCVMGMWKVLSRVTRVALRMIILLRYLAMTVRPSNIHRMRVVVVSCSIWIVHHLRCMPTVVVTTVMRIIKQVTWVESRIVACIFLIKWD